MSGRLRLIWHKLWLIPLVGATADVVASEAAKLGGVTVPIPWLFSAIGVAGLLAAAVVRAYSVPLIPEGLEAPDEALTRRSRILGERLGATPVRVFVSDLPKLRGKVDTFLDGHDLFVSKRVAELPEAERDFVLARALVARGPGGRYLRRDRCLALYLPTVILVILGWTLMPHLGRLSSFLIAPIMWSPLLVLTITRTVAASRDKALLGPAEDRSELKLAIRGTGDLAGALGALRLLAETEVEEDVARILGIDISSWWDTTGQKAVEASEWYQRERSLAAKAE